MSKSAKIGQAIQKHPLHVVLLCVFLFVLISLANPNLAAAQAEPTDAVVEHTPHADRGPWWTLGSRPGPHDRLIGGMATYHFNSQTFGWTNNWAFGVAARGFFAATFFTSYGDRGWAAGFERAWLGGAVGPVSGMIGFRTGLMYGYDEEFGWVADLLPILPFAQPVLMGRVGPVTLDITYTWKVMSFTTGLAVR